MTNNKYEVEIDKLLAENNPEYYNGLKTILLEFQEELISKGLIQDGTYKSYVALLKKISEYNKLEVQITYNLKESLEELGEGINKVMPSIESTLISQKYLNFENSKDFKFNQKVSELIIIGQKLNPSKFSDLIIQVYDQHDFKLLLIKLKILRFIDPNSDSVTSVFSGKPNHE